MEWKPIDTAPKDGRVFFVWDSRISIPLHCRWDFDSGSFAVSVPVHFCPEVLKDGGASDAAYWMPLPSAPEGSS